MGKKIILPSMLILGLGMLFFLQGCVTPLCGCSPPPDNREFLQGDWYAKEVSINDNEVTSDWSDFMVQFQWENYYVTSNSVNTEVWPESGNFEFTDGLNSILRSDSVKMTIDYVNYDELQLSISESSTGSWEFNFDRGL